MRNRKLNRILASLLLAVFLVSETAAPAMAAFASLLDDGQLMLTDEQGNTELVDASWEERFPYGTFAFGEAQLLLTEGDESEISLSLHRLGGTKGRAEADLVLMPAASALEEGEMSYVNAAGKDDYSVRIELPQPIAEYQPLGGAELQKLPSELAVSMDYNQSVDNTMNWETWPPSVEEYGQQVLYVPAAGSSSALGAEAVPVEADSYRWQIRDASQADSLWEDVSGAEEAFLPVSNELIYSDSAWYDFRCIYTIGSVEYYSVSNNGEIFVAEEQQEELPQMPEDFINELDPGFVDVELSGEEFDVQGLTLVFAEGEEKKEIIFSVKNDDLAEADEFLLINILNARGATLYDSANTISLHIVDDEEQEPSFVGFVEKEVSADKAAGSVRLSLRREGGLQYPVTVSYSLEDGTAQRGVDYAGQDGTAYFAPGMAETYIDLELIQSGPALLPEEGRSLTIRLGEIQGGGSESALLPGEESMQLSLYNSGEIVEDPNLATLLYGEGVEDVSDTLRLTGSSIVGGTEQSALSVEPLRSSTEGIVAELKSAPQSRSYSYGSRVLEFKRGENYDGYWKDWESIYSATQDDEHGYGDVGTDLGGLDAANNGLYVWDSAWFRSNNKDTSDNENQHFYSKNTAQDLSTGARVLEHNSDATNSMLLANGAQLFRQAYLASEVRLGVDQTDSDRLVILPSSVLYSVSGNNDTSLLPQIWTGADYSHEEGDTGRLGSYTRIKTGSVEIPMAKRDLRLDMALTRYNLRNGAIYIGSNHANGDSVYYLGQFRLERRTFENPISVMIHTANDQDVLDQLQVGDSVAGLDSQGYADYLYPTVSLAPNGSSGVNKSGDLYVGSTLNVSVGSSGSFDAATAENVPVVFLTDSQNKIVAKATPSGKDPAGKTQFSLKLLWNDLDEEGLKDNYTLNVAMTRRQEFVINYSPSLTNEQGTRSSAEAARDFMGRGVTRVAAYGNASYDGSVANSNTSNYKDYFQYNADKYFGDSVVNDQGQITQQGDAILDFQGNTITYSGENVYWLNFGQDAEDVILYRGQQYKGNETIWLHPADLHNSRINFVWYGSEYLSSTSVMQPSIARMERYLDLNGDGRVSGSYNENNGVFTPDETDLFLGSFLPNSIYEITQLQPMQHPEDAEDPNYYQQVVKVYYNKVPRSLIPQVDAEEEDYAQIVPYLTTGITNESLLGTLSDAEKSLRYLSTTEKAPLYGGEAQMLAMVDVPFGGDLQPPALKYKYPDDLSSQELEWKWESAGSGIKGFLLEPFQSLSPIYIRESVLGSNVPVVREGIVSNTDGSFTMTEQAKSILNNYLGSLNPDDTFGISVREVQFRGGQENVFSFEASAASGLSTFPDSSIVSAFDGEGGDAEGDPNDSGNDMSEFNIDAGVQLPTFNFGLTDFVSIVMDGYEVGFSIGVPLLSTSTQFKKTSSGTGTGTGSTAPGTGGTPPSGGGTPPSGGGTPPSGGGTPPAGGGGSTPGGTPATGGGGTPPAGGGTPPAGGGTPPAGGGTTTPAERNEFESAKNPKEANAAAMSELKSMFTGGNTPRSLYNTLKDKANSAGTAKGVKSKSFSVSLGFNLTILFKYNPLDNGYYFAQANFLLSCGLSYTVTVRLTVCPVVYAYFSVGLEINGGFAINADRVKSVGSTIDLDTSETGISLSSPAINKGNASIPEGGAPAITDKVISYYTNQSKLGPDGDSTPEGKDFLQLTSGASITYTSKHKAMDISFSGRLLVSSDVEGFVGGVISSDGSEPVTIKLTNNINGFFPEEQSVTFTALPDEKKVLGAGSFETITMPKYSYIDTITPIEKVATNVSFGGIEINPSLYVEVGAGLGVDVLKVEIFARINIAFAFAVAPQKSGDTEGDIDTDPFRFTYFQLSATLGIRAVLLFFSIEFEGIKLTITYDWADRIRSDRGRNSGWAFTVYLGGQQVASTTRGLGPVPAAAEELTVSVRPPVDLSQLQQVYTPEQNLPSPMSRALTPTDARVPFQLSGYGSSGDAFALADGLQSGGDFQLVNLAGETYIAYILSRAGAVNPIDATQLVISKVQNTSSQLGEAYGLVHPLDPLSSQPYLALDDDLGGDLNFSIQADEAKNGLQLVWTTYDGVSEAAEGDAQSQAAEAAKTVVVKTATLSLGDGLNPGSLSAAKTLPTSGESYRFVPAYADGLIFFGESIHFTEAEQEARDAEYDAAFNGVSTQEAIVDGEKVLYTQDDPSGYYMKTQKQVMDSIYGKSSSLNFALPNAEGGYDLYSYAAEDWSEKGVRLESAELSKVADDLYYLAYVTTIDDLVDAEEEPDAYQQGENGLEPVSTLGQSRTIRQLYLQKLSINEAGEPELSKAALLRSLVDYKDNSLLSSSESPLDGLYENSTLSSSYQDPYLSNLRFLYGKLGNLSGETENFDEQIAFQPRTRTADDTVSDKHFLLFEMNGETYIIPQASLESITDENDRSGYIIPFFGAAQDAAEGVGTTIGVDGNGTITAVYSKNVTGTSNNAIYINKYDALSGTWGYGTMLAMNHMDVQERYEEERWELEELEEAYFGKLIPGLGGMDSFSFRELDIALGDADELVIVTRGTLTQMTENTMYKTNYALDEDGAMLYDEDGHAIIESVEAEGTVIEPARDLSGNLLSNTGTYIISYGVGQQSLASPSISFQDWNLSAGAELLPTLRFFNGGDVGIRAGSKLEDGTSEHPIRVRLLLGSPNAEGTAIGQSETLAEWLIHDTIRAGAVVTASDLLFTMPADCGGKILYMDVEEAEYFGGDGSGYRFSQNTLCYDEAGKLEEGNACIFIEEKPELLFNELEAAVVGAMSETGTIRLNAQAANLGAADAEQVYLRVQAVSSRDEEGNVTLSPVDLTGHNLQVGEQYQVAARSAAAAEDYTLKNGYLLLSKNGESSQSAGRLNAGMGRDISGTFQLDRRFFSGVDNSADLRFSLVIANDEGQSREYTYTNNSLSQVLDPQTFFSLPSQVTLSLGSSMRLPVGVASSASLPPVITVTEVPEEDEKGIVSGKLGSLYYDTASDALVLSGAREGAGVVRLRDVSTNSFVDLHYIVKGAGEGVNIYNDNQIFSWSDPADWLFYEVPGSWGGGEANPLRSDLAQGEKGATLSFETYAESIDLYFQGSLEVKSDFPGFATHYISDGNGAVDPVTITFGRNYSDQPHRVTITIESDGTLLDCYTERFTDLDEILSSNDPLAPKLYWSRSLPAAASIADGEEVSFSLYVVDDSGIGSVSATLDGQSLPTRQGEEGARLWEIPFTFNRNGSFSLVAMDTSGNTQTSSFSITWFNAAEDAVTSDKGNFLLASEVDNTLSFASSVDVRTALDKFMVQTMDVDGEQLPVDQFFSQQQEGTLEAKQIIREEISGGEGIYKLEVTDEDGFFNRYIFLVEGPDPVRGQPSVSLTLAEREGARVLQLNASVEQAAGDSVPLKSLVLSGPGGFEENISLINVGNAYSGYSQEIFIPGEYRLTAVSFTDASASASIRISNDPLAVEIAAIRHCSTEEGNGSIELELSGGYKEGYEYAIREKSEPTVEFSFQESDSIFSNLLPGVYEIQVRDQYQPENASEIKEIRILDQIPRSIRLRNLGPDVEAGLLSADAESAAPDRKITLTPAAAKGCGLVELVALDENGQLLPITREEQGRFSFLMPPSPVELRYRFGRPVAEASLQEQEGRRVIQVKASVPQDAVNPVELWTVLLTGPNGYAESFPISESGCESNAFSQEIFVPGEYTLSVSGSRGWFNSSTLLVENAPVSMEITEIIPCTTAEGNGSISLSAGGGYRNDLEYAIARKSAQSSELRFYGDLSRFTNLSPGSYLVQVRDKYDTGNVSQLQEVEIEDRIPWPIYSESDTGGSLILSQESGILGESIRVGIRPNKGYGLCGISAKDESGKSILLLEQADGSYSFTMPSAAVYLEASFDRVQNDMSLAELDGKRVILVTASVKENPISDVSLQSLVITGPNGFRQEFQIPAGSTEFSEYSQEIFYPGVYTLESQGSHGWSNSDFLQVGNVAVSAEISSILDCSSETPNGAVELAISGGYKGAYEYAIRPWGSGEDFRFQESDSILSGLAVGLYEIRVRDKYAPESQSAILTARIENRIPHEIRTAVGPGGSVSLSQQSAILGDRVSLKVTPEQGFGITEIRLVDENGQELKLNDKGDGVYRFTMPSAHVQLQLRFGKPNASLALVESGGIRSLRVAAAPTQDVPLKSVTLSGPNGFVEEFSFPAGSLEFSGRSQEIFYPGEYTLRVLGQNGSSISASLRVYNAPVRAALLSITPSTSAEGNGAAHLEISGGYSDDYLYGIRAQGSEEEMLFHSSPAVLSGLSAGMYEIQIRDAYDAENFSQLLTVEIVGDESGGGSGSIISGGSTGGEEEDIQIDCGPGGSIILQPEDAEAEEDVQIIVLPDAGYELDSLIVRDADGKELELKENEDGSYDFSMPEGGVRITASFRLQQACSGGADCPSAAYRDLSPAAWYHEAVDYVLLNGIMGGYGEGLFGPNDPLSRAQLTRLLYNREGQPSVSGSAGFSDVPAEAWFHDAVAWAAAKGIVTGYADGSFGPNDPVTREQLAAILWRYAKLKGLDVSVGENTNILSYTDAFQISEYALPAMQWACGAGIIGGYGDGSLQPGGNASRAQVATMMQRFCQLGK